MLLRNRFQQRLQRVLRDQLIGLERQAAISARCDLLLRLCDGWIWEMEERRLDEGEHDEYVHRAMRRERGGAHPLRNAHAAVYLHGARIAAFHFWKELRRLLLLDDHGAYAAQAEIDGKRQAGRASPDNEHLGVHDALHLSPLAGR